MRLFKVALFCLFFVFCGEEPPSDLITADKDSKTSSIDEMADKDSPDQAVSVFQNLEGRYQGAYKGVSFEIWIENISSLYEHVEEIAQNKVNEFAVLVFEKEQRAQVETFLKKYQVEHQPLYLDVCKHVEPKGRRYPYSRRLSSSVLWNQMGALAFIAVPANLTTKQSLEIIQSKYFIYFEETGRHFLKFVNVDSTGKALSLSFLNTGFLKKIWNRFFSDSSGPKIEIKKISVNTSGLLANYTLISNVADGSFEKARKNDIPACD